MRSTPPTCSNEAGAGILAGGASCDPRVSSFEPLEDLEASGHLDRRRHLPGLQALRPPTEAWRASPVRSPSMPPSSPPRPALLKSSDSSKASASNDWPPLSPVFDAIRERAGLFQRASRNPVLSVPRRDQDVSQPQHRQLLEHMKPDGALERLAHLAHRHAEDRGVDDREQPRLPLGHDPQHSAIACRDRPIALALGQVVEVGWPRRSSPGQPLGDGPGLFWRLRLRALGGFQSWRDRLSPMKILPSSTLGSSALGQWRQLLHLAHVRDAGGPWHPGGAGRATRSTGAPASTATGPALRGAGFPQRAQPAATSHSAATRSRPISALESRRSSWRP